MPLWGIFLLVSGAFGTVFVAVMFYGLTGGRFEKERFAGRLSLVATFCMIATLTFVAITAATYGMSS